ncbi:hypothetical protein [Desulfofalx alkaliphila]|uniref:hypothetical protein n=1 Tax=Desulfofalx alkaliphila TaxID=105483 RepID=UPI0004E28772|nr:hypothetical protein [Desulfofalx alkaliphila]
MPRYSLWTHFPEDGQEKVIKSRQIDYNAVPRIGEKVVIESEVFAVTDVIHETDENRIVIKLKFTTW